MFKCPQSSCSKFVCGPWVHVVEVSYIQTDALSASVCHPKVPVGPCGKMQPWGQQKPEKLLLQSTSGDHWKSFLKNMFIWCFLYPVRNTWNQHLIQYLEWNTTTGLPKWWFPTVQMSQDPLREGKVWGPIRVRKKSSVQKLLKTHQALLPIRESEICWGWEIF